jgi:hypothetical protein
MLQAVQIWESCTLAACRRERSSARARVGDAAVAPICAARGLVVAGVAVGPAAAGLPARIARCPPGGQ